MSKERFNYTFAQIRTLDDTVLDVLREDGSGVTADLTERVARKLKARREPWALSLTREFDFQTRVSSALKRLQARALVRQMQHAAGRCSVWSAA